MMSRLFSYMSTLLAYGTRIKECMYQEISNHFIIASIGDIGEQIKQILLMFGFFISYVRPICIT